MKHVTLKELKAEVFNKHLIKDTYIRHNNSEFGAGKAVFDVNRGFVIRQVSDDYKLITNEDLVKWIKSDYSVKFLSIYKTKSQDTVYIKGYIPEFSFEDSKRRQFYISFEIVNSYSSRFLPAVYLGVFYPNFPSLNIRTDVRVTPHSRDGLLAEPFNPDLINSVLDFIQSSKSYDIIHILIEELPSYLPKKLRMPAIVFQITQNYKTSPIGFLELCAKITNIWEETAYESSRAFQMQEYSYLIERISDDNNKQE